LDAARYTILRRIRDLKALKRPSDDPGYRYGGSGMTKKGNAPFHAALRPG
jgi:hypothetical protein